MMLLQLLVTGVLVKSGPGTGLNVAFLEGDTSGQILPKSPLPSGSCRRNLQK